MFLVIYIKRLVYIIFLTMIAPLVALSYPLDKMKDGSAQGFNTWLKEYMFNLLIQPMHLLLYYVLVGSAVDLATKYVIYPLVVLGFMLPAEKVLRKLFGFEKSSTASSLFSGAMGGAAVMQGVNWLSHRAKGVAKGGSKGSSGGAGSKGDSIRTDGSQEKFKGGKGFDIDEHFDKDESRKFAGDRDTNAMESYENASKSEYGIEDEKEQKQELPKWEEDSENPGYDMDGNLVGFGQEYDDFDASKFDQSDIQMDDMNELSEYSADKINIPEEYDMPNPEEDINQKLEDEKAEKRYKRERNWDAIKAAANEFGINKESAKKLGKGAIRGAVGVAGAATLGTVGIAAGLASDEFKNVAKFGIAGGAAGFGAGSGVTGKIMNDAGKLRENSRAAHDAWVKAAKGKDEYQKMINERLNAKHMKDNKTQLMYKEAFEKDWKKAMEASLEYRNQTGVTDNDTIIKAMKAMKKRGLNYDDRRGLASAKLADKVTSRRDIKDITNQLSKRGIRQDQIQDTEDIIREIKGFDL